MKFSKFLSSLLPSFEKSRVIEDIEMTREEIARGTLPIYDSAATYLRSWKIKNAALADREAVFKRTVKHVSGGFVVGIQKGLKQSLENLDVVEDQIKRIYNEDVAGGGLTYLKANLLQFVEASAFVSKYARKFLLFIYLAESAEFPDAGITIEGKLSKGEVQWLDANFLSFCTALDIVATPVSELRKVLGNIPDIVVTAENAETLPQTLGAAKLDPLNMGLIPVWMNPIYHIGVHVAEWQASRYNAAKEEVKLCEMRLLNLKRLQEANPDAGLERQIGYTESRVDNLNYRIEKMEREYA